MNRIRVFLVEHQEPISLVLWLAALLTLAFWYAGTHGGAE